MYLKVAMILSNFFWSVIEFSSPGDSGKIAVSTLAPGEECKGDAFGFVCLFASYMSVRTSKSKTIAPIDLACFFKKDVLYQLVAPPLTIYYRSCTCDLP